jgi:hypothetical protein
VFSPRRGIFASLIIQCLGTDPCATQINNRSFIYPIDIHVYRVAYSVLYYSFTAFSRRLEKLLVWSKSI